jgi:hypothetical protein
VKYIRPLLTCLVLVLVLAVFFLAAVFSPDVQTWVAQRALARQPGLHASLGSLSAGLTRTDVTDLRLEINGAVLTLPSLQAWLPLTTAVGKRKVLVRSLVARGWTLDLSHRPESEAAPAQAGLAPEGGKGTGSTAPAEAVPAQKVVRVFRGILGRWVLPCDVSLDEVDLEGDVLVVTSPGTAPSRVHVTVKGGGIAAGHEGALAFDAAGSVTDPKLPLTGVAAHGRLIIAMTSPRILDLIEIKANVSAEGGSRLEDLILSTDIAAAGAAGEETYTLELSRGNRPLATVLARFPEATRRFEGTWKVDLQDADLARFFPNRSFPSIAAAGDGGFDADATFIRVHASGRLNTVASHLGVLDPLLERLGAVTLDTRFDLVHSGQLIQVDRLSVSLPGNRPAAVVRCLQPFSLDERTGDLKVADPRADWMEGSIRGLPLAWLSGLTDRFTVAGGDAAGEFTIRAADGGFALRPKTPLTSAGVAVEYAGRTVGRKLDLSLSLLAAYGSQGWQIQAAPLKVGSGGCDLAEFDIKATRLAGPDQPIAIGGTWKADLQAPTFKEAIPDFGSLGGRSASGEFSAVLGASTELDGKLAVAGRDARRSMSASMHLTADDGGRISFLAPVKVAFGPSESDMSVEGTIIRDVAKTYLYLKLTGKEVVLEHLRLLTGAVAAAGLPRTAATGQVTPSMVRDQIPFWGDWTGRINVAFDRLKAGDMTFEGVAGAFQVDPHTVHIEEGRGAFAGHHLTEMAGSLSYDATAASPYSLKATVSLSPIEAADFFPAPHPEGSPLIEGRFSVAGTLVGNGINLADLVNRTQEEIRLSSAAGIVRVLKTDVDEAIPPDTESPATDTLDRLGSAVGGFFGAEGSTGWGKKSVSPAIQTVIGIINDTSEIGFDEFTVTAVRGADRTIRLVDLAVTAGDEHATGSGLIAYVPGLPFRAQPLRVDLQFGARGQIAKLLSAAGLLSAQKDGLGFMLLSQPISLGGTLQHVDTRQWHDLLVKAAKQTPAVPKKGG